MSDQLEQFLLITGPEVVSFPASNNFVYESLTTGLGSQALNQWIELVVDADAKLISKRALRNFAKFYPAGSSVRQFQHFKQLLMTGEFKKYDYESAEGNQAAYGQDTPPEYNLSDITGFNITLVCGKGDLLCSGPDYKWLHDLLASNGNTIDFMETDLGHLGLLIPESEQVVEQLIQNVKSA